jgi:hypothetical protein
MERAGYVDEHCLIERWMALWNGLVDLLDPGGTSRRAMPH